MHNGIFMRVLVLVLVVAALAGCLKKAGYIPDGKGGYALETTTDSPDKAMIRFRRTATDLCPGGSFAFGEPATGGQSAAGTTYAIDVVCTAP